jgi:hypothetical protein
VFAVGWSFVDESDVVAIYSTREAAEAHVARAEAASDNFTHWGYDEYVLDPPPHADPIHLGRLTVDHPQ